MLILTRKLDQKILIGDGPALITITVVEIESGKVRLGIEAPRDVAVDREEVRKAKKAQEESMCPVCGGELPAVVAA